MPVQIRPSRALHSTGSRPTVRVKIIPSVPAPESIKPTEQPEATPAPAPHTESAGPK